MFKKRTEVTPDVFKLLFTKFNELVESKRYPFIYSVEDSTVSSTSEARAYSKEQEHSFPKICNAYVTSSIALRLTANFYLKFNKPVYPSKIFSKMNEAEKWCFEEVRNYSSVI